MKDCGPEKLNNELQESETKKKMRVSCCSVTTSHLIHIIHESFDPLQKYVPLISVLHQSSLVFILLSQPSLCLDVQISLPPAPNSQCLPELLSSCLPFALSLSFTLHLFSAPSHFYPGRQTGGDVSYEAEEQRWVFKVCRAHAHFVRTQP